MVDALNTTHIVVNRVSQAVSPEVSLSAGTKLVAIDRLTFELQHDSGLKVRISIREGFLDLHLTLPSAACSSSPEGVCGRCVPGASDACDSDDHPCLIRALGIAEYLKFHPTASSVTVQNHLTSWKTSFASSVFARAMVSTTVSSPTSIAVSLTGGGFLVSAPIPGAALASDHLTVSVSLRVSSATNLTSSVLWTYAHTHVFAVLIQDGRLALYFNGTVTGTELVVHVDVWTQVSLVYERQRGVAVMHYLWYSGTQVRHLHQVLRVAGGALPGGGTVAVGTWQTSLVVATRPRVSIAVLPAYRTTTYQANRRFFVYFVFFLTKYRLLQVEDSLRDIQFIKTNKIKGGWRWSRCNCIFVKERFGAVDLYWVLSFSHETAVLTKCNTFTLTSFLVFCFDCFILHFVICLIPFFAFSSSSGMALPRPVVNASSIINSHTTRPIS